MSVIEKMSITGIRSFSPDDRQVIEFFRPLTLILGPNGCGKTTLIECLRYVTTGDMPPNSDRGGSFVHDPKFAGEQEVKAQVKLQFKDVMGKKVIVTRSLMVSQTLKKLTLKTLEGTLTRYGNNGEKTQLSTKCAEIDAEMIGSLGVSKAILNHVIFCHQEESNWPLSEGKALKQRFDEIFAATRYIKALDEIRKIRTEKMGEIKIYETQVESLVSNKRKADEFQRELESTESRLSASKDTAQNLEDKMKPNAAKLLEIKQKQETIGKLQGRFDKGLELLKKYEKDEKDLRRTLGDKVFVGTIEDLKKEVQNFKALMDEKKIQQRKLLQEIATMERSFQAEQKKKSKLLEELGTLKSDHNRYTSQVKLRDSKLRDFRRDLGLGEIGFDEDEPLDETQVSNVMQSLKQRNGATRIEHQNCKTKHEANESRLVNAIQETCMEKAQKQMKLSSNNEQVAKNKTCLRNINDELTRLDSLANLQDNVEKDLKEAEEELKSVESSTNVEELRQQLSAKQQKRDETDAQLTALNQEMNILQKESKVRHEIDLYTKDLNSKQESVDRVLNRHKDTLIHLLQKLPEHGVYEKVTNLVQNLNQKTQEVNKDLEKLRSKLSSLETTKKIQSNQLSCKEELLTLNQNKIFDVCGSQDFECGFEALKTNIQSLQDEKGTMTGSLYLFNKYVEELQRPRSKCPLCKRGFDEAQAAKDLVEKLQQKLQLLPRRMEEKTKLLADKEKQLTKLMELRPVKEAVTALQSKEIPELKTKLESVSVEITETRTKIGELDDLLDNVRGDLNMASNLLPELVLLDQNQGDVKRLARKLASLKAQIGGKDTTRTVQQVSEEQTTLQAQIKSLGREVGRLQERINGFVGEVQLLRGRVNDLKAEKNQMCSDLQKRVQLTQQVETVMKENAQLAEATKVVKSEIFTLEGKIKDLNKEKAAVTDSKEEELTKLTSKMREEERELELIEATNREINRYLLADSENKLVEHEDKLAELSSVLKEKQKELAQKDKAEKALNQEINTQELMDRNLSDNVKLFEVVKCVGDMNAESEKLKREIGGYDVRSLDSEMERVASEQRLLAKQRDEAVGRADVLRDQIRGLRKQLSDNMFKDADLKHRNKCIELRTTQLVCEDLNKYYKALNNALMTYHQQKMKEINKIIKELWYKTYAGNDIDFIEIQSDEDGERGLEKARRTYNYRVVMFKGNMSTDMRGRCSAGQKVLASLIIRLALAETFCLNCGILALDEPTTNLDRENISKLARALIEIVESRSEQRNFQLIIITHDEDFITCLGRSEIVDYYYKVSKDNSAHSRISKLYIADMA